MLGYYDGLRMLYGLAGEKYYIDRKWNEMQAYLVLRSLMERFYGSDLSLRELNERILPKLARKLKAKEGDYHDILIRYLEMNAAEAEITPFQVRTETELLQAIIDHWKNKD